MNHAKYNSTSGQPKFNLFDIILKWISVLVLRTYVVENPYVLIEYKSQLQLHISFKYICPIILVT